MASSLFRFLILGSDRTGAAFRSANRNMQYLRDSARDASYALGGIFGGFQLIRSWHNAASTYQNLANRLRLVTENTRELADAQDRIFDISQRTYTSVEGGTIFYARMALAAQHLGWEGEKLFQVLEAVNKAVAISGSTAQEARAGLIQFSQGLASGRFQGDELRSVAEQIPGLARAISDGLGVTIGGLREMGAEGKLNVDLVINALLGQSEAIAEDFTNIQKTLGQSWTMLGNSLERLFARDSQLGQALVWYIDKLRELVDGIYEVVRVTDAEVAADFDKRATKVAANLARAKAEMEKAEIEMLYASDPNIGGKNKARLVEAQKQLAYWTQNVARYENDRVALLKEIDAWEAKVALGRERAANDRSGFDAGKGVDKKPAAAEGLQLNKDVPALAGIGITPWWIDRANKHAEEVEKEFEQEMEAQERLYELAEEARVLREEQQLAEEELEEERRQRGLERWQEYWETRTAQEEEHAERQRAIEEKVAEAQKITADGFMALFKHLGKQSRTWFKIQKTAATALAIINTHEAITKALAAYPPPWNYAAAAAVAASGFARVAAIQSQQFGGGGSTSASVGGGSVSPVTGAASGGGAAAASPGTTVNLEVREGLYSDAAIIELVKKLNAAFDDGITINAVAV